MCISCCSLRDPCEEGPLTVPHVMAGRLQCRGRYLPEACRPQGQTWGTKVEADPAAQATTRPPCLPSSNFLTCPRSNGHQYLHYSCSCLTITQRWRTGRNPFPSLNGRGQGTQGDSRATVCFRPSAEPGRPACTESSDASDGTL